jgi:hypothetical protein
MTKHMSGKWCIHYRAMSEHKTCEAGVDYESLKGLPFDKRPCFKDKPGDPIRPGCDKVEYPTPEQQAEYEAAIKKRMEGFVIARKAIVDHLGGPWKRGTKGASGEIDCPVCKTGKLRFSRAGVNGHIHAGCTTKDCVGWME